MLIWHSGSGKSIKRAVESAKQAGHTELWHAKVYMPAAISGACASTMHHIYDDKAEAISCVADYLKPAKHLITEMQSYESGNVNWMGLDGSGCWGAVEKVDREKRTRRPGAGRKPKPPEEKVTRVEVYLPPDLAAHLQQQAGTDRGAQSRYMAELLRQAYIASLIV